MSGKAFYITTAIDYVNSVPHIGHAYEKVCADALARWKRMEGRETFFLIGNDEHSANVEKRAASLGLPPLQYCDQMEPKFVDVWKKLNISYDRFIRTSNPLHHVAVKELFARIHKNGDIFKGKYKGWYCVSCEAYKKEGDLVEGKCPTHQTSAQQVEEENYFFKLTKYRDALLDHIEKNPSFIVPKIRKNEILSVLREGLEDVSVSRSSTKWGVPLPIDPSHAVYVWFDALINYLTGIGFPDGTETFEKFWPADIHMIGKDITRFHCIMWPAMLLSAGLPLPKTIAAHGFVYVKGQKMSKTLGTVIDPAAVADKYGHDALRYFLLREIAFDKDGDFSWEKFIERYNADLANDLGNLLHRTLNMINRYQGGRVGAKNDVQAIDSALQSKLMAVAGTITPMIDNCEFHDALATIWDSIKEMNTYVEKTSPWTLSKQKATARLETVLSTIVEGLRIVAVVLKPFIPLSAEKIWDQLGIAQQTPFGAVSLDTAKQWQYVNPQTVVKTGSPIFPKIEIEIENE